MAFADLTANLNLNTRNFSNALKRVDGQYQSFVSRVTRMAQAQSKHAEGLVENYKKVGDSMHYLGLSARDVSRIFSGIIISQAFYRAAEAIRDAASALWEFNEQLDYARVTYAALMGDSNISQGFLNELQQFSIETVFGFSDLEKMSRKLLAYGIEYKNLMYIVQGLTNIGTLSGDAAALERLAVAIGQINAKGVLKAEEVRQLTNAYVPMYDILREELGFTEEQLKQNIGDLGISSAEAINAIMSYSNKRFGETAEAAMLTITGLNQRIVDSVKVMGADMLQPVAGAYKSLALFISQQLEATYDVYKAYGAGGVFEHLVPGKYAQQLIREYIANFINGIYKIVGILHAAMPLIQGFFGGFMQGLNFAKALFNAFGSVIVAVLQTLGIHTPILDLLSKALYIAGFAFAIFVSRAMAAFALKGLIAVFTGIAKAVVLLTAALVRNPIVLGLLALAGVLAAVTTRANSTNNAVTKLVKTLSSHSLGGKTADDILQPSAGGGGDVGNANDYWNAMEEGAENASDAMDGAGKAADKAAKKANKSLLSFDEVFKLNEPTDTSGAGGGAGGLGDLSGIEDLTGALGGLGGALVPEVPSFKDFAKNFVGNLYNDLWDALKSIASGATSGALIGGLIGFAIGGLVTRSMSGALGGAKLGAKIGAVVGGGFAAFWTDVYNEMEASLFKIAKGGAAGTLAGGLVGFVLGAFTTKSLKGAMAGATFGASIGSIVGMGVGGFWAAATEEMNSAIEGLAVGSATGMLIGALAGLVIGAFATKNIKGAMAGATLGAKIGTAIGAGLGTFWGSASEEMKKAISNVVAGLKSAGMGMLLGALAGMVIGAVVGAMAGGVGAIPGAMAGAKLGAAIGGIGQAIYDMLDNSGAFKAMSKWFKNLGGKITKLWSSLWKVNTWKSAWEHISSWFEDLTDDVSDWFEDKFGVDVSGLWETVWKVTKWATGWGLIELWFKVLNGDVQEWFDEKVTSVKTWWENLWTTSRWATGWSKVTGWFSTMRTNVSTWFSNLVPNITSWWSNLWTISRWATGWSKVTGWFSDLRTNVSTWFSNLVPNITSWWNNLWTSSRWATAWSRVTGWFSTFKTSVKSWFEGTTPNITSWWNGLWNYKNWTSGWNRVKSWFSSLRTAISNWFTSLKSSIGTWWDNLWAGKKGTVKNNKGGILGWLSLGGHATGGIFDKEHIARFAEGNKAEAIIPLENSRAMQPFVDAVSNGLLQSLAPTMVSSGGLGSSGGSGNYSDLPPMYVGTLIADERGLRELYKKFEIIQVQENARKGFAT